MQKQAVDYGNMIPKQPISYPVPPFNRLLMLLYGMPGTGKTKFAASCPNSLFLATEPGQQFTMAPVITIREWSQFQGSIVGIKQQREKIAAGLLPPEACPYTSFVIDIVDNLHGMCLNHICKAKGITYPPKNDFGKTWKEITNEWTYWLHNLMTLGNVIFISHSTTVGMEIQTESGATAEVDTHIPSFSGNKAAQFLDGILSAMGFLSVDKAGQYVITFRKTSQIGAKDRTDILSKISPLPTNWDHVAKAYEVQALKMGFEIQRRN